jgi:tetratricopeptide (TPR) repeat protein
VHASSQARFEEGYRNITDQVKLRGWDDPKANILNLVHSWLCNESNGRWIMIVDNANDPSVFFSLPMARLTTEESSSTQTSQLLSDFLLHSQSGSILITSRSRDLAFRLTGSYDGIIAMSPMDEQHALALLCKKLTSKANDEDAVELVKNLDYMPLAITQAAAYIRQRAPRYTVSRHLKELLVNDKGWMSLLQKDVGDSRRDGTASNSIIATWQISFEHIRRDRPSAAQLLSFISLFDRQGIPEYLLYKLGDIDSEADSAVDPTDKSAIDFEDDIYTLTNYSLISSNISESMFEMHRLVQFSMKRWLTLCGELEKWKERYIRIMHEAFPEPSYENWTVCQALFPHTEVLLSYRPANRKCLEEWAATLSKAASYARYKGSYIVAGKMEQEALDLREEVLGKEHPDTLISTNNFALLLLNQGKYDEAEPLYRQTLALRGKVLGREHPDTLMSMNNLALLLDYQGKYDEAEPMYRQTLALTERVLGKEHPNTLLSMNNLALLLGSQGKYDEAEPLYR